MYITKHNALKFIAWLKTTELTKKFAYLLVVDLV